MPKNLKGYRDAAKSALDKVSGQRQQVAGADQVYQQRKYAFERKCEDVERNLQTIQDLLDQHPAFVAWRQKHYDKMPSTSPVIPVAVVKQDILTYMNVLDSWLRTAELELKNAEVILKVHQEGLHPSHSQFAVTEHSRALPLAHEKFEAFKQRCVKIQADKEKAKSLLKGIEPLDARRAILEIEKHDCQSAMVKAERNLKDKQILLKNFEQAYTSRKAELKDFQILDGKPPSEEKELKKIAETRVKSVQAELAAVKEVRSGGTASARQNLEQMFNLRKKGSVDKRETEETRKAQEEIQALRETAPTRDYDQVKQKLALIFSARKSPVPTDDMMKNHFDCGTEVLEKGQDAVKPATDKREKLREEMGEQSDMDAKRAKIAHLFKGR